MNEWRQEDIEKAGLADWQDMENEKEGEINCTQVSGLNDWLAGWQPYSRQEMVPWRE